jgi:beta-glucosidase
VVSVFFTGRPLWINPELNASQAFVVAWLPGSEGVGVADVLFTDAKGSVRHNFRGRLSFSWPGSADQLVLNRGDDDYDPLFPYGYGLSYGSADEISELPEERARTEQASRTVYFQDRPVAPWKLFLEVEGEPAIAAGTGRVASSGSNPVVVRGVDRRRQEDARAVAWPGGVAGRVFLKADPVDISREANGLMVLAFDVLVEKTPTGEVSLAMECGEECCAEIDLTATLTDLPTDEWQLLMVPLGCFVEAGADMSRIDTPFSLSTQGELAIRFSDVRLATVAEEGIVCP